LIRAARLTRRSAGLLLLAAALFVVVGSAQAATAAPQFRGAMFQPGDVASFQPPTSLTPVGLASYSDMAVDDAHQHVFISGRDDDAVVVMDFNGMSVTTITGLPGAEGLAIDQATHTLYVAEYAAPAIAVIDTQTLALRRTYALGTDLCPQFVEFTAGRVWFSYACERPPWTSGIGSVTLSSGAVHTRQATPYENGTMPLTVDPTTPNVLYSGILGCPVVLSKWNVRTATPQLVGQYNGGECSPYDAMHDIVAVPGRGQLVTVGEHPFEGVSWKTSDMTPDATQYQGPGGYYPLAVTASSDGALVAIAGTGTEGVSVTVSKTGSSSAWSGFAAGGGNEVAVRENGLAFTGDASKLFAVVWDDVHNKEFLSVMSNPGVAGSFFHFPDPVTVYMGDTVTLSGTLTLADGASAAGQTVHLVRENASDDTEKPMLDVTTDSSGTFTFSDIENEGGVMEYWATWDGDATHSGTVRDGAVIVYYHATSPGTLALSPSASSVAYQGVVTVTASLSAPAPPGDPTVTIYAVPVEGGGATSVTGTLDGSGTFSHDFTLARTTRFWATWAGDGTHTRTDSPVATVAAGSSPSHALSGYSSYVNGFYLYKYSSACVGTHVSGCPTDVGTVAPDIPGRLVCFSWQQHDATGWHDIGERCGRLDADGHAGLHLFYRGPNIIGVQVRMRMTYAATRSSGGGTTGWLDVRVTK
jgi:hypothetical protein